MIHSSHAPHPATTAVAEHRAPARQRILSAALSCFSASGLGGATMAAIARAAGVSAGALYLHFANKRALFESLGRPELEQPAVRRRARRMQILSAALHVFGEKGYVAATMDEIAATAELSKAALYGYFKSKAELFVGVIRDASLADAFGELWSCARVGSGPGLGSTPPVGGSGPRLDADPAAVSPLGCAAQAGEGPAAFLQRFATRFLEEHRDPQHIELMRFVLAEGMRDPEVASAVFNRIAHRATTALAEQLATFELGPPSDLLLAAQSFMGTLFSWVVTRRVLAQSTGQSHANNKKFGQVGDGDVDGMAGAFNNEAVVAKRIVHLFLHGLYGYKSKPRGSRRATKRKS